MKIIIDIPEDMYKRYIALHMNGLGGKAEGYIANGEPLAEERQEKRGTNVPTQKTVPPMPKKNKKYKEKYSWVPVKDRLPEVDKEVFVYLFPSNVPYIARWNGTHWQTDEFCLDDYLDEGYEPLAWFPLPEPYKGE